MAKLTSRTWTPLMKVYQQGFSLIELLTTIVVLSVTIGIAIPSFSALTDRITQYEATNRLAQTLYRARFQAITQNRSTTVCHESQGSCSSSFIWQGAMLVYQTANQHEQTDEILNIVSSENIPTGYSWHWSGFRARPFLTFKPNGATDYQNGTFTLCRNSEALKQVVINKAGRVRIQSAPTGSRC